jgi:N-acetylmuramoyl-L-alanine amidase
MKTAILLLVMVLVSALVAFNYGDGRAGPEPAPAFVPDAAAARSGDRQAKLPTAQSELAPASEAQSRGSASSRASRGLDTRMEAEAEGLFARDGDAAPEDEATTAAGVALGTSDEVAGKTSPARVGTTSDATTPERSAERAAAASSATGSAATSAPERAAAASSATGSAATPPPERAAAASSATGSAATSPPERAATTSSTAASAEQAAASTATTSQATGSVAASSADPSAERSAATSSENAARTGADSERDEAESRRSSRRGRWYRWDEDERYPNLDSWVRPDGPVKIALQAGHWKSVEAPDEQSGLRNNGTRGGGLAEWQVNLAIARKTAALLEERGYAVEILPTTIPPGYFADVFVSIHADGNNSASVTGYRAAAPRRDRTGRADALADVLTRTYGAATGLRRYPTITRRMSSYYAFNYRRYEHSLHPMTVGVILETGFLTSPRDRRIIVDAQERAARGIADAVIQFLTP